MTWAEFDAALDEIARDINSKATNLDGLVADVARYIEGLQPEDRERRRDEIAAAFTAAFSMLPPDEKYSLVRKLMKEGMK